MNKPYRIVCTTSDKYLPALLPYAYLLKKYWPNHPEVVVVGFTPPAFDLPAGFSFWSAGPFEEYPVERWSDALIKYLNWIADEVIILQLEDYWLYRPVYNEVVDMAYDYMRQFHYVARLDLTGDRAGANAGVVSLYGKLGHVDLVWSDPDSPYHLSLMTGMWRREHLLRVLVPGETPWDVELKGTTRLAGMRDELVVVGTKAWPIAHGLAFRSGDGQKLDTSFLPPAAVVELEEKGLLEPWREQ